VRPVAHVGERVLVGFVSVASLVAVGLGLRWLTGGLGAWDAHVLARVAQWRDPLAVHVARVASLFGRAWVVLVVAAVAGWLLRRGGRAKAPLWSVLVAIASQNLIKVIVRRPRPPVHHLEHVTSWSFPSGHATESTALLMSLIFAAWPLTRHSWTRGAMVGAALAAEFVVAASRVVLGVHYPTDVIAGFLLGDCAAALAVICARPTSGARRTPEWLAIAPRQ
jgi:undecaprenyl-diphosphatase